MYDKVFKVKLISSKNSFIFLSEPDSKQLDHEHLIRLSYGLNKRAFFSLGTSLKSLKDGELSMDSMLAKELGIGKNDTVTLSSTPYIASIRRLNLLTVSQDDYEMLEVLAETVQSTLLNQVKIVHNNQKMVIWISNNLHVTVNVDGVEPISPGKLELLTEVSILPPQQEIKHYQYEKRASLTSKQEKSIFDVYNQKQFTFRLLPVECIVNTIGDDKKALIDQPFNVFLSKSHAGLFEQESYQESDTDSIYTVRLLKLRILALPPDIQDILNETHHEPVDSIIARLFFVDMPNEAEILAAEGTNTLPLYVNKMMFEYFHSTSGAKVVANQLKQLPSFVPRSIEIITSKKFLNQADELVRDYLCSQCLDGGKFAVNSNLVMEEPIKGCRFALAFNPANERFLVIDSNIMRGCKFELAERELVESKADNDRNADKPVELCLDACNYNEILSALNDCLLKINASAILSGKCGSGKTSLMKKLCARMKDAPYYVYTELVSCKKFKGKNIDSFCKALNMIFLRLIYYQPSLLILDDLHIICEKMVESDQPTQEALHFNKISEMLADKLESLVQRNRISLVATTESMGRLNNNIYNSRGKHLFKNCFNIDELNKNDRITILKYLFGKKEVNCEVINFNQLGIKTEGFIIQDLIDLADKIIFQFYKESINSSQTELQITDTHCESALGNMSALSLRNVHLHSAGDRDFSDIGGLDGIKKILVETMLWPAQYANIFARSPLRLQSGVLLYGAPGTGKTILAGAAAKQCNLRLISVKGPELLSKYIGASEQAVRDIFQKAQSAKPCILFFDEFDSLAPRRGHDNTGVTDRVVNQFLTQLDGVESLTGVCVLAATSRPDLLDPALLRPGRLDRQLMCPMPDQQCRLKILKSLSKNLNFVPDINLETIAEGTEAFSGADLQAVLYTAQLNSMEHLLTDTSISASSKTQNENQLVTQKHLNDALKSTRPSLTKEERAKYDRIYQKFQGKGDILESLKLGKQRTTLA